jgi:hypothetical protein
MTGVRQIDADTLTQSGLVDPAINDSSLCPLDPTSRVIALGIRGHHPRSLDPSIPRSYPITRFVQIDRIGSMTWVRQIDTDTGYGDPVWPRGSCDRFRD